MLAPQLLVEQLVVVGDERIRGTQDAPAGAVVLLQLDDFQARVIGLQQAQILDIRATPGVDRLIVIAHGGEGPAVAGEQAQQGVLRAIGVLILVDQQIAQPLLPARAHRFVVAEQAHRQADEVVKIDRLIRAQGALVFAVHLGRRRAEFGVRALDRFFRRHHRVLPARDLPLQRARVGAVGVGRDVAHDLRRVGGIENRELGLQPAELRLLTHDAHPQRVKGAHRQPLAAPAAEQPANARLHLLGGLVGEGDGGDVGRAEIALLDQMRDLVGDHPRLAAARAGEHQTRAVEVADRFALRGIECSGHAFSFLQTSAPPDGGGAFSGDRPILAHPRDAHRKAPKTFLASDPAACNGLARIARSCSAIVRYKPSSALAVT